MALAAGSTTVSLVSNADRRKPASGTGELGFHVSCRKKDDHHQNQQRQQQLLYPYQVFEITPPRPTSLGVRSLPLDTHCGETVEIEGRGYTVSAVVHRYQLRKGRYEPSEKRLDVLSTGRYIVNLFLDGLLERS